MGAARGGCLASRERRGGGRAARRSDAVARPRIPAGRLRPDDQADPRDGLPGSQGRPGAYTFSGDRRPAGCPGSLAGARGVPAAHRRSRRGRCGAGKSAGQNGGLPRLRLRRGCDRARGGGSGLVRPVERGRAADRAHRPGFKAPCPARWKGFAAARGPVPGGAASSAQMESSARTQAGAGRKAADRQPDRSRRHPPGGGLRRSVGRRAARLGVAPRRPRPRSVVDPTIVRWPGASRHGARLGFAGGGGRHPRAAPCISRPSPSTSPPDRPIAHSRPR
jgi:hypothetical protein